MNQYYLNRNLLKYNMNNLQMFNINKIKVGNRILIIGEERSVIINKILGNYKTVEQLRLKPYNENVAKRFVNCRRNLIEDYLEQSVVILDTHIDYKVNYTVHDMLMNTGHLYMVVILGQETYTVIPPALRSNIDYVFLTKNSGPFEKLYKYYGGCSKYFKECLDKTSDTLYMVLYTRECNIMKDYIYYIEIKDI